jgi:hypothetical protein
MYQLNIYIPASILLFFALSLQVTYAATASPSQALECEYAWAFEQCKIAQQNGSSRSIDDPLCSSNPSNEMILDQIILDELFQEIDEQAKEYLLQLSADKDKYFWPNAQESEFRAIDDVTKNFWGEWVYYKLYQELCDGGILAERMTCTWKVPNQPAALRIKGSFNSNACMELVNFKLGVYMDVAYVQLKVNKSQVQADSHKEYVQQERTKYDALLTMMGTLVGHVGRLARGVTHWTPNPLQSSLESIQIFLKNLS